MTKAVPMYAVRYTLNGREITHVTLYYDFAMSYIHALLNDRVCDKAVLLVKEDCGYDDSYFRVMGSFKRMFED